jgi:hypothetical protein
VSASDERAREQELVQAAAMAGGSGIARARGACGLQIGARLAGDNWVTVKMPPWYGGDLDRLAYGERHETDRRTVRRAPSRGTTRTAGDTWRGEEFKVPWATGVWGRLKDRYGEPERGGVNGSQ